ncbi:MAG: LysM peptidoglycan-binding domain-containing protein [Dechloromonas sp.]|nr:MAG: LysM peptidoglycan-binding domain-containing protein [Dechloromonas sp.]
MVDRSTSAQPRASAPVAPSGPGYYTVKRGDTLYRIALDHGQDYKDIAAWNNISNPGAIREGQVLRVVPPGAATAVAGGGAVVAQPVVTAPVVETQALDAPGKVAGAPAVAPASTGPAPRPQARAARWQEPYSDEAYARLNRAADTPPKPVPVAVDPKSEAKPRSRPRPSRRRSRSPSPKWRRARMM